MFYRYSINRTSFTIKFCSYRRLVTNKDDIYILKITYSLDSALNIDSRGIITPHCIKGNSHASFKTTSRTLRPLYEPQLGHTLKESFNSLQSGHRLRLGS